MYVPAGGGLLDASPMEALFCRHAAHTGHTNGDHALETGRQAIPTSDHIDKTR